MQYLHAKSACCHGKIYHFGQRRRQCSVCHGTWRIRAKKIGRKGRRQNSLLVERYFRNGGFNLEAHSKKLHLSADSIWHRLRQSRDYFLKTKEFPLIPQRGKLIMVIDALRQRIDGQWYSVYLRLIRPIKAKKAIILEPVILPGWENKAGWNQAIDLLPESVKKRIIAIIGDGLPSFVNIARENDWLLQRCHFHLLKELHCWFSRKRKSRHQKLFNKIEQLIRTIVTTVNQDELNHSLQTIKKLIHNSRVPDRFKTRFLKGFVRHYELYRTYLKYPELNLPTTSNSCEAVVKQIRKLLGKANGFNSKNSFDKWIKAWLIFKKDISCK